MSSGRTAISAAAQPSGPWARPRSLRAWARRRLGKGDLSRGGPGGLGSELGQEPMSLLRRVARPDVLPVVMDRIDEGIAGEDLVLVADGQRRRLGTIPTEPLPDPLGFLHALSPGLDAAGCRRFFALGQRITDPRLALLAMIPGEEVEGAGKGGGLAPEVAPQSLADVRERGGGGMPEPPLLHPTPEPAETLLADLAVGGGAGDVVTEAGARLRLKRLGLPASEARVSMVGEGFVVHPVRFVNEVVPRVNGGLTVLSREAVPVSLERGLPLEIRNSRGGGGTR